LSAGTTALPLAGIRVVEFVHMVMGPTCGLILGDLGADVIKVEPLPAGDHTRKLVGAGAGFFTCFNRNKRSLAVDLKSPAGLAIVLDLIDRSDVVSENFRPGAMDALGLGQEALRARNPQLIYSSAKGFLAGPYEHRTALDEVVQMMGGLAYMTGPPGRPLRAGASVNDIMGGMFAALGVVAALYQRRDIGHGQTVRSGLFENNAFLVAQHMAQYAVTGVAPDPMPNRLSAWAIYDVFATADDDQVFLAVVSDSQWKTFCAAFDKPDWFADERLVTNAQRCHARSWLLPMVATLAKSFDKATLMDRFESLGLPYAPITRPEELFDDPHLLASGGLLDVTIPGGKATQVPALPLELDGQRLGVRLDVPEYGQHTREILAELGRSAAQIDALIASGTVAAA
jgi:crotonobetainyl-CoA:carnitine CoA-transferase CaiB-like acyl-CoA transferase